MSETKQQTWRYDFNQKRLYQPDGVPVMVKTDSTNRYAIFSSLKEASWWVRRRGPVQWSSLPVEEIQ